MATPTLKTFPVNGLEMAVWEWTGAPPALVFVHATGFHGRCWDQIVRRFPGRHCLAVDVRGHGRSSKPDPPYLWLQFGRDLAALMEHLEVEKAIGIGHSMGGHTVVAAAIQRPRAFGAMVLVDPTIFPREDYGHTPFNASFIRRRRNAWSSPEEMFASFRDRTPFVRWQEQVLRDYCEFGLLQNGEGFVLACPPAVEASIYEHSKDAECDLYGSLASVAIPVTVMRAGTARLRVAFDPSASPAAPGLATHFPAGRDVVLPERTHFIPMEAPDSVAAEIARLV